MQQLKLLPKIKSNKTRAFTLVEMIIAISLGLMVLTIGTQLLITSSEGSVFATREKELQDANRIFLEQTNNSIKYATAVFTVPTKTFNASNYSKLSKDWNYLGIKKDVMIPSRLTSDGADLVAKTALVDMKYVGSGATPPSGIQLHDNQVLITVNKGGSEKLYYVQTIIAFSENINNTEFIYDIVFSKETPTTGVTGFLSSKEGKGLNYKLSVKAINTAGSTKTEVDYGIILSKITALNSFQVVDRGTPGNPAVAIAYRTDNIFKSKEGAYGVVSMVLDNSGSMSGTIEGGSTSDSSKTRIGILKKYTKELLTQFCDAGHMDIAFIPFDNYVLDGPASLSPYKLGLPEFLSVKNDKALLEAQVNYLNHRGATNTANGIRYAFYKMAKHNETLSSSGIKYKDYLIILVDGESNCSYHLTTSPESSPEFYDGDDYYTSIPDEYADDGNYHVLGRKNITYLAKNLYDKPYSKISHHESATAIETMINEKNVFLIGFSKDSSNGGSLAQIANDFHIDMNATGENQRYFEANSESALALALSGIGAAITKDLWLINGPEL